MVVSYFYHTRLKVPWGQKWVYFALHLYSILNPNLLQVFKTYLLHVWISLSVLRGNEAIKNPENKSSFQKSRSRHHLPEYFTIQIEMGQTIAKRKTVNEICKHWVLRGSLNVTVISPESLRLCQYLPGPYQSSDCLLYSHMEH